MDANSKIATTGGMSFETKNDTMLQEMRQGSIKLIVTDPKNAMTYLYDKNDKSNNWKKMHGVPLKSKGINILRMYFCALVQSEYVSKRSKKKQKKAHFRHSLNICKLIELEHDPNSIRIYNRYGYAPKKMMKKIKRLRKKQLT